jgi:integrase
VVKAAGLPTTGPDKITPHTLRHTAATWGMQNIKTASDVWELAAFLGMSYEMLIERYGRHCPNFQSGAVAAISARRSTGTGSVRANKT